MINNIKKIIFTIYELDRDLFLTFGVDPIASVISLCFCKEFNSILMFYLFLIYLIHLPVEIIKVIKKPKKENEKSD